MPVVRYNSYTLPKVREKFSFSLDEEKASFACNFVIIGTSSANLVSLCDQAEEKLTEVNKDFTLTFGGSSEYDFDHSANTGFLGKPSLTKIENRIATGLAREYKFTFECQLPFDQSGYDFQRSANFSIDYTPNRGRTATFNCVYTAGSSNSALDNYNAGSGGGKDWAEGILTTLGGVYDPVRETINEEREEKILNATLVYQEILAKQSDAGLDHTSIINPQVDYSVEIENQVGISQSTTMRVTPRIRITTSYSCTISKDLVAAEADIEAVYQDVVKPYLINNAALALGLANYKQAGTTYVIELESKRVNPYSYNVAGTLVFSAPKNIDQIMELSERISILIDDGVVEEKLWDEKDNTYNIWSIGKRTTLTRLITVTKYSTPQADPPRFISADAAGKYVRKSFEKSTEQTRMGVGTPGDGTNALEQDVYSTNFIEQYLYVVPVETIQEVPE